eukprot:gene135-27_t
MVGLARLWGSPLLLVSLWLLLFLALLEPALLVDVLPGSLPCAGRQGWESAYNLNRAQASQGASGGFGVGGSVWDRLSAGREFGDLGPFTTLGHEEQGDVVAAVLYCLALRATAPKGPKGLGWVESCLERAVKAASFVALEGDLNGSDPDFSVGVRTVCIQKPAAFVACSQTWYPDGIRLVMMKVVVETALALARSLSEVSGGGGGDIRNAIGEKLGAAITKLKIKGKYHFGLASGNESQKLAALAKALREVTSAAKDSLAEVLSEIESPSEGRLEAISERPEGRLEAPEAGSRLMVMGDPGAVLHSGAECVIVARQSPRDGASSSKDDAPAHVFLQFFRPVFLAGSGTSEAGSDFSFRVEDERGGLLSAGATVGEELSLRLPPETVLRVAVERRDGSGETQRCAALWVPLRKVTQSELGISFVTLWLGVDTKAREDAVDPRADPRAYHAKVERDFQAAITRGLDVGAPKVGISVKVVRADRCVADAQHTFGVVGMYENALASLHARVEDALRKRDARIAALMRGKQRAAEETRVGSPPPARGELALGLDASPRAVEPRVPPCVADAGLRRARARQGRRGGSDSSPGSPKSGAGSPGGRSSGGSPRTSSSPRGAQLRQLLCIERSVLAERERGEAPSFASPRLDAGSPEKRNPSAAPTAPRALAGPRDPPQGVARPQVSSDATLSHDAAAELARLQKEVGSLLVDRSEQRQKFTQLKQQQTEQARCVQSLEQQLEQARAEQRRTLEDHRQRLLLLQRASRRETEAVAAQLAARERELAAAAEEKKGSAAALRQAQVALVAARQRAERGELGEAMLRKAEARLGALRGDAVAGAAVEQGSRDDFTGDGSPDVAGGGDGGGGGAGQTNSKGSAISKASVDSSGREGGRAGRRGVEQGTSSKTQRGNSAGSAKAAATAKATANYLRSSSAKARARAVLSASTPHLIKPCVFDSPKKQTFSPQKRGAKYRAQAAATVAAAVAAAVGPAASGSEEGGSDRFRSARQPAFERELAGDENAKDAACGKRSRSPSGSLGGRALARSRSAVLESRKRVEAARRRAHKSVPSAGPSRALAGRSSYTVSGGSQKSACDGSDHGGAAGLSGREGTKLMLRAANAGQTAGSTVASAQPTRAAVASEPSESLTRIEVLSTADAVVLETQFAADMGVKRGPCVSNGGAPGAIAGSRGSPSMGGRRLEEDSSAPLQGSPVLGATTAPHPGGTLRGTSGQKFGGEHFAAQAFGREVSLPGFSAHPELSPALATLGAQASGPQSVAATTPGLPEYEGLWSRGFPGIPGMHGRAPGTMTPGGVIANGPITMAQYHSSAAVSSPVASPGPMPGSVVTTPGSQAVSRYAAGSASRRSVLRAVLADQQQQMTGGAQLGSSWPASVVNRGGLRGFAQGTSFRGECTVAGRRVHGGASGAASGDASGDAKDRLVESLESVRLETLESGSTPSLEGGSPGSCMFPLGPSHGHGSLVSSFSDDEAVLGMGMSVDARGESVLRARDVQWGLPGSFSSRGYLNYAASSSDDNEMSSAAGYFSDG